MISAKDPYRRKRVDVNGHAMAYVETGSGDPIVFIHGNPTSSYEWRNVIPHLEGSARCIAPDLIGMGESDRLPDTDPESYALSEHIRFMDGFIEAVGAADNVTFVLDDWGVPIGFDWVRRHEGNVRGVTYFEGPLMPGSWSAFSKRVDGLLPGGSAFFKAIRTAGAGEKLIMEDNLFIEKMLPEMTLRKLSAEELAQYGKHYIEGGENRRALLSWPRQGSFDGEPAHSTRILARLVDWLKDCETPKLFIRGDHSTLVTGAFLEFCQSLKNQSEITVHGAHLLTEDSPHEIGQAVAEWYRTL